MKDWPFVLIIAISGLSLLAIAAYHGCMLAGGGWVMGVPYEPEVRRKIAELYRSGTPVAVIAGQTGACFRSISIIARQEGCPVRPPGGPHHSLDPSAIARALDRYAAGVDKVEDILAEEGLSHSALIHYVDAAGITRRRHGINCCEVYELRRRFSIADTADILGCCAASVQRAQNRHRDLLAKGIPESEHHKFYDRRKRR